MPRPAKPIALCGDRLKISNEEKEARLKSEERYRGKSDMIYECPSDLETELEREIYMYIVNCLKPANILQNLDIFLIKNTVQCIIHMNKANELIKEQGITLESPDGKIYKNPAVTIAKDFFNIFVQNSNRLGLSPADRAKLSILDLKQTKQDQDPLLQLLADRDNAF